MGVKSESLAALANSLGLQNRVVSPWKGRPPPCDGIIAVRRYLLLPICFRRLSQSRPWRPLRADSRWWPPLFPFCLCCSRTGPEC